MENLKPERIEAALRDFRYNTQVSAINPLASHSKGISNDTVSTILAALKLAEKVMGEPSDAMGGVYLDMLSKFREEQRLPTHWMLLPAKPDHIEDVGEKVNLNKCPSCGGPADNGADRCDPPNVYNCTKCEVGKQ